MTLNDPHATARRQFVLLGGGWLAATLIGCKEKDTSSPAELPTSARAVLPASAPSPQGDGKCAITADNIEGPYYRAGAPFRADLVDPGSAGTRLLVAGRVLAAGCATPLEGAVLDVWQATPDGHYDNDGSPGAPPAYRLRGKLKVEGQRDGSKASQFDFVLARA